MRDILLVDGSFLGETVLYSDGSPIATRATEKPNELERARKFLQDLRGSMDSKWVDKYSCRMSDEEMRHHFPELASRYERRLAQSVPAELAQDGDPATPPPSSKRIVDALFEDIMNGAM